MAIELASVRYWGLTKEKDKPVTFISPDHPQYKHYATTVRAMPEDMALCNRITISTDDPPLVSIHHFYWAERKILRQYFDNDLCDQHSAVESMPVEWKHPEYDHDSYVEEATATKERIVEDIAIPKELIK